MVKTKKDWENNLKEFNKMRDEAIGSIATINKTIEEFDFYIDAIKSKIKSFK